MSSTKPATPLPSSRAGRCASSACRTAAPTCSCSTRQLFIHLRTATKDVFPSHWDVCIGGVLAASETFDQGVRREIQEELGVDAVAESLFPINYADEATIVHGMVYRLVHDGPFRLQVEEIVRGEFASVADVLERISRDPFCPDGVKVLQQYLRDQ